MEEDSKSKNEDDHPGVTKPWLQQTLSHQQVSGSDEDGYTVSIRAGYHINQGRSPMRVAQYTWDHMTEADRKASDESYDALLHHEEGHMEVAEQQANSWNDAHQDPITAKGATVEKANANLDEKLKADYNDKSAAANARQAEYDAATNHGIDQSRGPQHKSADGKSDPFPGGKDAKLTCPKGQ